MIFVSKKVYGLKLVRNFPLVPRSYRSAHDDQKNLIWNDKAIVESLRNAIENNTRSIKEEKYNKIIAEAMIGNHWAEDFIDIWNSKNIKKAWIKYRNFPNSYAAGRLGDYLNTNGKFSKLDKNTWIFESEKEAIDYASDTYEWGCLIDLVEIVEFNLQIST